MNTHALLRKRLHNAKGLPLHTHDALAASEWSDEFERMMRNRLIMGALRYGLINEEGKPRYDRVGSMKRRLDLYSETGNLEHLVDVANLALMEFEEGRHPNAHFASLDDGHHTRTK